MAKELVWLTDWIESLIALRSQDSIHIKKKFNWIHQLAVTFKVQCIWRFYCVPRQITAIFRYYPGVCLKVLRKNYSQDGESPGRDLNPRLAEYEAEMQTAGRVFRCPSSWRNEIFISLAAEAIPGFQTHYCIVIFPWSRVDVLYCNY